ncbi:MAG: type VI secretion system tip protein VgrG [Planctomycetes bacterium]|nr:type VI secretion system tip protein VgrG [Planctomycetota bacterium]
MAQDRAAHEADFTFQVSGLSVDLLKVTGFTGTEGISELFHFRVELCSDEADVSFDEVVGQPCTLQISGSNGQRYINGIVRSFERTGEGANLTKYAAEIVPIFWLLTKRYKSRIFQEYNCSDMTVPGIVQKVFEDAGIPEDNYRLALEGDYDAREFVVQYRESDMDFVSRLMEHEGIFYFFEHDAEGKHIMVIGDSGVAHTVLEEAAEFHYREPTGLIPEQEYVFRARDRREIQIGAICLDDYNFKQPAMELRATREADQYTSLEFSDYPGLYMDSGVGDHYTEVRLEEYQCARHVAQMTSVVRALLPGYKFTLIEHPSEALNIEWLVTHLTHRATQPQSAQEEAGSDQPTAHETDIRAIPADVPFRPPRKTRRPVVLGTQTALVTGPSGEEIYTDDDGYGRVKVHFHWDREGDHDENSSCWIRVSQGWAGGNYGMIFLPRVGQEVIVEFLEGDPDRPIITGRVYNNDNMPPYRLPDEKTKSTIHSHSSKGGGGFNEFRFEDKKGEEQIFMHGEKDLDKRIKNDERDFIGRDKHEIIKRHQKKKIEGSEGRAVGGDQITSVGGERHIKVKSDSIQEVEANYKLQAAADVYIKSDKCTFFGQSYAAFGSQGEAIVKAPSITLDGGGSFIKIDSSGVTIFGALVKINSGGSPGATQAMANPAADSPAAPDEAATGDPGQDFTYQQQRLDYDPLEDAEEHDEETSDETHWIGIRLWDDNGTPLVGERYIVVLPDGNTVARGRTNRDGEAEIRGIDPGTCQVKFPNLDATTWEAGTPPGGTTGGAGAADGSGGVPGTGSISGGGGIPGI